METKICITCRIEQNIDNFSKAKQHKDGHCSKCKSCYKQYKKDNAEILAAKNKIYRMENKEMLNIRKKQYTFENKERIKEYQQKNKDVISKQRVIYRKEHKEVMKEYNKKYNEINGHTLESIEKGKQYRIKNKEKLIQYRIDNKERAELNRINYCKCKENKDKIKLRMQLYNEKRKEHNKERGQKWRKDYPEKSRLACQKRRAIKRNLPCDLTIEQWENIKLHFNNKCCYCGKESPLEQEHFLALTKGGEFTFNNIIPACRSCNAKKYNKNFFEWYPKQKSYSIKREKFILKFLNYKNKIQQLTFIV